MENKLKQYFPIIQQIYFYGSIKGVYTIVLFEKNRYSSTNIQMYIPIIFARNPTQDLK